MSTLQEKSEHRQTRREIDPHRLRERMIEELRKKGITDEAVLQAMRSVRRELFVEPALRVHAYQDMRLSIGFGQTISRPYTVAVMTSLLQVQPGMRVLEIGTGSGYQTAVLVSMGCTVHTAEIVPELFERSKCIFHKLGLTSVRTHFRDGTLGLASASPFDRIIVTAGGPKIPEPLLNQLTNNGILIIPVGEMKRTQRLLRIRRSGDVFKQEDLGPAAFVDLVGDHGW